MNEPDAGWGARIHRGLLVAGFLLGPALVLAGVLNVLNATGHHLDAATRQALSTIDGRRLAAAHQFDATTASTNYVVGTVTSAATGNIVSDAYVVASPGYPTPPHSPGQCCDYTAFTDNSGQYSLTIATGNYSVAIRHHDYQPASLSGGSDTPRQTFSGDAQLQPLEQGVSGQITGDPGIPVTVNADFPEYSSWNGMAMYHHYQLTVTSGQPYLLMTPEGYGYVYLSTQQGFQVTPSIRGVTVYWGGSDYRSISGGLDFNLTSAPATIALTVADVGIGSVVPGTAVITDRFGVITNQLVCVQLTMNGPTSGFAGTLLSDYTQWCTSRGVVNFEFDGFAGTVNGAGLVDSDTLVPGTYRVIATAGRIGAETTFKVKPAIPGYAANGARTPTRAQTHNAAAARRDAV
ncbi:MAG: hypothetical protein ACYDAY_07515 [Candidatus Dormibacteria bacterium]